MTSTALPVKRGCGSRKEGGVYLECGLSPFGRPIEDFLFDPPLVDVPDEWLVAHRTPLTVERDGVTHVVIWVGAEFYPNVFDFIEETRVAGASRRVPTNFDFSQLGPESQMFFVHAHAAVDGEPLREHAEKLAATQPKLDDDFEHVPCHCPTHAHTFDERVAETTRQNSTRCLGLAKYLLTSDVHDFATTFAEPNDIHSARTRTLPCGHSYALPAMPPADVAVKLTSRPAMFLRLPLTAISCITKSDGTFDEAVEQRVRTARGVDVVLTDK